MNTKISVEPEEMQQLFRDARFLHELSSDERNYLNKDLRDKFNFYNNKNSEVNGFLRFDFLNKYTKSEFDSNIWKKSLYNFIEFFNNSLDNTYSNPERTTKQNWIYNLNSQFSYFIIQRLLQNKDVKLMPKSVLKDVNTAILENLYRLTINVIAVELNLSRVRADAGENKAHKIFDSNINFVEYFNTLREYPVLIRFLFIEIEKNYNFFNNLFHRIKRDLRLIQKKFSKATLRFPSGLKSISSSLSDSHNDGCYVVKIIFENDVKIFYKPKSLITDHYYNGLISFVNKRLKRNKLKHLKIIAKNDYGYCELIEHSSCITEKEIMQYYYKIGGHLAIVYAINGNDFHYENIIASHSNPILVDLETLFFNYEAYVSEIDKGNAFHNTDSKLRKSVLGTGFLPYLQFGDEKKEGYDVSGLGGKPNQIYPRKSPKWKNIGEQNMFADYAYGAIEMRSNLPHIKKKYYYSENYLDEITAGFSDVYKIILKNRRTLFKKYLINQEFCVRHIMRPTKIYYQLLGRILHPVFLRNGVKCSIELEVLNRSIKHKDEAYIVQSELEQLCNLDIPTFYQCISKKGISSARKHILLKYFNKNSKSQVSLKILKLNEDDLKLQVDLIRSSILNRINKMHTVTFPSTKAKEKIPNYFEKYSMKGKRNTVNWISYFYNGKTDSFSIAPLDRDLYSGIAGVLIGYASYLEVTKKNIKKVEILAKGAYDSLCSVTFESLNKKLGPGIYNGYFSIINGLLYLKENFNLLQEEEVLKTIPNFENEVYDVQKDYDQMSGVSGILTFLCHIYKRHNGLNILQKISDISSQLVLKFNYNSESIGFAHGNTGVGYSLYKAGECLNNNEMMENGIAYIYNDYDRIIENKIMNFSWCRGISGIGLAILQTDLKKEKSLHIINNITTHILENRQSLRNNLNQLCCGTLGVADFLIELKNSEIELSNNKLNEVEDFISDFIDNNNILQLETPNCNIPNLSLFRGISGFSYLKNRRQSNAKLPSVLIR
jgi:type 2 lantibiotic biosynthesis protein LanM